MTIRTRFTLLFAAIVGIILFFFSFSIYFLSENFRQNDFHARLQDRGIARFKFFMVSDTNNIDNPASHFREEMLHSVSNERIAIYNASLARIYSDSGTIELSADELKGISAAQPWSSESNTGESIGFLYHFQNQDFIIVTSGFDQHGMNYMANLRRVLFFRGFILLLIIFISGWLYAGQFLKPIANIVQQVESISFSNLNKRLLNKNASDEIGRLTATFNNMLERLEKSFNAQKRFVSNASHELRNPLTAINGQIDVALLKDRSVEEYKQILKTIAQDNRNLRTLTNNLLELASSDETLIQHFEELRIDEILWNVHDEMAKQHAGCVVNIQFEKVPENEKYITCKGDRKLLETACTNIIDNACKFSNQKPVEVKIGYEKTMIVVQFIDQGIGMPEEYLHHVFEPFYRGSNALGIRGNGIGLPLVQRIVQLHSGSIQIQSGLNKRTKVEVRIPNLSRF